MNHFFVAVNITHLRDYTLPSSLRSYERLATFLLYDPLSLARSLTFNWLDIIKGQQNALQKQISFLKF